MKKLFRSSFKSSFSGLAVCVGIVTGLANSESRAQQSDARLLVEPKQKTYLVGEPVVVALILSNASDKVLHAHQMSQEVGYLKFHVVSGVRPPEEHGFLRVKDPSIAPVELPPQGQYTAEEMVHYNFKARKLSFSQPGRHVLRAEYRGVVGQAATPVIGETTIEVVNTPESERTGSAMFSDPEVGRFLANGSRDPGVISRLKQFAADHPNSRFAAYGNFFVGTHEMRLYSDKPRNYPEAERLFKACDRPGFQFRSRVLLGLAEVSLNAGRPSEATIYLNRLAEERPPSGLAARAQMLNEQAVSNATRPRTAAPESKPTTPVPEAEAKAGEVISSYFDAYQKQDVAACLKLLAENFRYNDALGKSQMAGQLREDFDKLRRSNPPMQVRATVSKVASVDGRIVADVEVTFSGTDGRMAGARRVKLGLLGPSGNWLIEKWNSLD